MAVMPRRNRALTLVLLAFVVALLVYSSHLRQTAPSFYDKTLEALHNRGRPVFDASSGRVKGQVPLDKDADGDIDADDVQLAKEMGERLRSAEKEAKDKANAKAPNKPDAPGRVVGIGSSASGQGKKKHAAEDVKAAQSEEKDAETEEEHTIEVEMNSILKKAPVIIFSKSYCPYSKRAKGVLLEKYHITPEPYVVELDVHPLGPKIQDRLLEMTGRRTVPNIMINGKSIGGSDDIIELDHAKELVAKIKSLGGKRVGIKERFSEKNN